jgi:pimeloyl-ACP methyl ester carboxylesterase
MKVLSFLKISRRTQVRIEKKVKYSLGESRLQKDTNDVTLRGIRINGNTNDLPNLIFFPDMFDSVENWLPFFMNKNQSILDHRNVYILYPRNFGFSDYCNDANDYGEAVANDVERFMYENQISTATIGGHGLGAKTALLTGCYKSNLVTGYFGFDYSPLNYHYFEFAHTYRHILNELSKIDFKKTNRNALFGQLTQLVQSPKLLQLLKDQIKYNKNTGFEFKMNVPFVNENFDMLLDWVIRYGLFGGRSLHVFPEHSSHVHLSTNTMPMYNICIRTEGFNKDVFAERTECDNPVENHWIYENQELSAGFRDRLINFLEFYDGVHLLYKNRLDLMNGVSVPTIAEERVDKKSEDVPFHPHHNWRFKTK